MNDFFNQYFFEKDNKYSVIVEDNGEVAYAYLLEHEKIISDIWLYNSISTPPKTDWNDIDNAPFLNPSIYTKNLGNVNCTILDNIKIKWELTDQLSVTISLSNGLKVKMKEGVKPGWSNNVFKSGPLASVLKEND